MANWLVETARRASVAKSTLWLGAVAVAMAFALIQEWLGVLWLSVAAAIGLLAVLLEALWAKARARSKRIEEEWPTVIESLESAAQAGLSLTESLRDLAESSQLLVAKDFAVLCSQVDAGVALDSGLQELKQRFGLASCDLTIETLRLVNEAGGHGYLAALQLQSRTIRERTALMQQVSAKQGWVVSTAKLAVAAPWFIVTLLSFRQENALVYNSPNGQLLLAFGLLASFVAVRLVSVMGRLQVSPRVLA